MNRSSAQKLPNENTSDSAAPSVGLASGAAGGPQAEAEFVLSPKAKWMLIGFGSLFGILGGLLIGYGVQRFFTPALPEGSSFENLSDFRTALSERDDRDKKADNSVSLRSIMVPDSSDQIIYRLAPNLDVRFQDAPVRTNSHGMRGPETTLEKPADVYRIALMGDSFAFGWGVEEKESFATLLGEYLNQAGGIHGKKVEILNFGVPGYSTFQETALFQNFASKFSPDAVLVFFVDNDFGLPFFIRNIGSITNEMITNNNFSKGASSDDPEVQKRRAELVSLLDANQALIRLSDSCKSLGIPLLFTINPGKTAPKMLERLSALKERPEIRHLWLRDLMLDRIKAENIDPKTLTLKKDPHPSPLKHKLLAEFLVQKIREYPDLQK